MVVVRLATVSTLIEGGTEASACGSSACTRFTASMTLAPGCLKISSRYAVAAVLPGVQQPIFRAVDRDADVANAHRRAVLVGHDHVVPGRGLQQLIIVVDRHAARRSVDRSLGRIDRGRGDDAGDILHLQTRAPRA